MANQAESILKKNLADYIRIKYPNIFFWFNKSHGTFNPITKKFMKNNSRYAITGVSDILGILPNGRFLAIEVKTPKGRLSPTQIQFLASITDRGGLAFVARSYQDIDINLMK